MKDVVIMYLSWLRHLGSVLHHMDKGGIVMKKAAIIMVSLCLCLSFVGCKSISKEAAGLQQTMLGHWKNGGGGEIFLSPTTMTMIYKDEKYVVTYRVTGGSEADGILNTKVNEEQAKKIKSQNVAYTGASPSNELTLENGVLNPGNFLFNPSDFKLVDNKQNP